MEALQSNRPLDQTEDLVWPEGRDLWRDFKAGDRAAFDSLYQLHIQHLISYGSKITGNRNIVQDCIQDLFVELWDNREHIAQAQSVKYYLLKSLRYKIIRQLQGNRSETLDESHFAIQHDNAESLLLLKETALHHSKQLATALLQLPKRQREAIYLRYFEELSNEEVARIMGVNYQSACKFIYTALKTLRGRMQLSALVPLLLPLFIFS